MDSKRVFLGRLLACRAAGIPAIAEVKAHTPTAGDLLRGRPVEDIARQYEKAGMACISVVTGRWFGGSPVLLARVAKVTSLPILQKDFVVSRSAIDRSQQLGASAVLLTRKLVSADIFEKLVRHAISRGLTPFIEVGSAIELRGLHLDVDAIIAVNNRDIRLKETDGGTVATSLGLLDAARATGAGAIVSASGIATAGEARQVLDAGFDGLLIGSAFLQAANLGEVLAAFGAALRRAAKNDDKLS